MVAALHLAGGTATAPGLVPGVAQSELRLCTRAATDRPRAALSAGQTMVFAWRGLAWLPQSSVRQPPLTRGPDLPTPACRGSRAPGRRACGSPAGSRHAPRPTESCGAARSACAPPAPAARLWGTARRWRWTRRASARRSASGPRSSRRGHAPCRASPSPASSGRKMQRRSRACGSYRPGSAGSTPPHTPCACGRRRRPTNCERAMAMSTRHRSDPSCCDRTSSSSLGASGRSPWPSCEPRRRPSQAARPSCTPRPSTQGRHRSPGAGTR
mmetsp:Transcript_6957/g.17796  ORF Transcript_6957/g.17796 Transcript_6957/m.17796 type:complete len:270 (+) Transcript_6957:84-893(+)